MNTKRIMLLTELGIKIVYYPAVLICCLMAMWFWFENTWQILHTDDLLAVILIGGTIVKICEAFTYATKEWGHD